MTKKELVKYIIPLILIVPAIVLAAGILIDPDGPTGPKPSQPPPERSKCCIIKHNITVGEKDFSAGSIIKPEDEYVCPLGTIGMDIKRENTHNWAGVCLLDSIMSLAEWVLWLGAVVSAVGLMAAGAVIALSRGNPEMVDNAKKFFKYSLIGVLVIALSQFLPGVARYFIGI